MTLPCNNCDISSFCLDIGRCLGETMYKAFGESDAEDGPIDLTADDHAGEKPIIGEDNIFKTKLSDNEAEFIKAAIK